MILDFNTSLKVYVHLRLSIVLLLITDKDKHPQNCVNISIIHHIIISDHRNGEIPL